MEAFSKLNEKKRRGFAEIIVGEMLGGKIIWVSEKKRPDAMSYVLLKVAGIPITQTQIKILDLEREAKSLDQLVKIYKEKLIKKF